MKLRTHLTLFLGIMFILTVFGCKTTKNVQMNAYQQDKKRLDQEISGNVGNWQNAPAAYDDPTRKKTRRMYFFEFSKDAEPQAKLPEVDIREIEREPATAFDNAPVATSTRNTNTTITQRQKLNIPRIDTIDIPDDDDDSSVSASSFIDYKVEKDDTLQKISKKFYDSYSQWPKIYEANKSTLKSPDFLKPGIVLRIPVK